MRRFILFMLCLCVHWIARGQTSYDYRYWFDNDVNSASSGTSAGSTWHFSVPLDGLEESLHVFHFQVCDTAGVWSAPVSRYFVKLTQPIEEQGTYWFDDDYSTHITTPVTNGIMEVDVSALADGFHAFHYMAGAHTLSAVQTSFFIKQTDPSQFHYLIWAADDPENILKGKYTGEPVSVDVSSLTDGFHTLYVQVVGGVSATHPSSAMFIKIPQTVGVDFMNCLFMVDDKFYRSEQVPASGGVIEWTLDVNHLDQGLHRYLVQVVTPSGAGSTIKEGFFLRETMKSELQSLQCCFMVDGDSATVQAGTISNGVYHFDLDVSKLTDGLHRIAYWLVGDNAVSTTVNSSFFVKTPVGGNGITQYQYWLNDLEAEKHVIQLAQRVNPLSIITLLPVETQPLRSANFQFAFKNGQPLIYAKNELHLRFFDAANRFTQITKEYVDEQVTGSVEPVGELQATQTFPKVAENDIRWYTVPAEPGDTLAFRLSQAATLQLFSPSGKEVFSSSADASVKYNGIHSWEDGTYYLAVHDVTGSKSTMTLDYIHMDKYDVVDWDVHTVGNGGCSTITFKGNGFRDLYAVDLYTAEGDTIHSLDVSHDSDAETAVTFDFSGAKLGVYDAVFHFTEEDKLVSDVVTVEEATEIDIDVEATFNKNNLISFHKTKYIFSVYNNSNMTAYDVPLMIRVYTHDANSLERVDVDGYDLAADFKKLFGNHYTDSLANAIETKRAVSGDRCFFMEADSTDIVAGWAAHMHQCFVFPTLPPNSKKDIVVSLELGQSVYCYMWHPEEWDEGILDEDRSKVKRRAGGYTGICGRDIFYHIRYCQERERYYREMNTLEGAPYPSEDCSDWSLPMPCPGDGGNSSGAGSNDPNDVYGYLSEAGSKFIIDSIHTLDYGIEFENDTTFATASAHKVIVCDTLDSRYFDLKSFVPTTVKIGNREVELEGRQNFVTTLDLRPEINVIAQVEGTYDNAKGIAKWTFTSLDPMTMEPTDDFMSGILPVNYDGTSGIGEVFFDINLKQTFVDGTEIPNRASITFDANDEIQTPTWVNIIDAIAPMSTILGAIQAKTDTLTLRIAGEDNRSGVWRYDVYAQIGQGSSWEKVAENVPAILAEGETETLVDVRIFEGIEYGFMVLATDSAGNMERKAFEAEFELSTVKTGDANGDGVVDALDVILATSYYLGKDVHLNFAAADVVADGEINSLDVIAIQNIYLSSSQQALSPRKRKVKSDRTINIK